MKWDREKAIHQKLVGEIQQIQAKIENPIPLHPNTSKDIQILTMKPKQDWEALPYHEENKKKESCDDIAIKTTKINEQKFFIKKILSIPKGKLKGMLDDQNLNMKVEVKLGQLIKISPNYQKY
jgi:hypothetical protein